MKNKYWIVSFLIIFVIVFIITINVEKFGDYKPTIGTTSTIKLTTTIPLDASPGKLIFISEENESQIDVVKFNIKLISGDYIWHQIKNIGESEVNEINSTIICDEISPNHVKNVIDPNVQSYKGLSIKNEGFWTRSGRSGFHTYPGTCCKETITLTGGETRSGRFLLFTENVTENLTLSCSLNVIAQEPKQSVNKSILIHFLFSPKKEDVEIPEDMISIKELSENAEEYLNQKVKTVGYYNTFSGKIDGNYVDFDDIGLFVLSDYLGNYFGVRCQDGGFEYKKYNATGFIKYHEICECEYKKTWWDESGDSINSTINKVGLNSTLKSRWISMWWKDLRSDCERGPKFEEIDYLPNIIVKTEYRCRPDSYNKIYYLRCSEPLKKV